MRTNGCIDARHVLKVAGVGRAQNGRHANCVLIAGLCDLHSMLRRVNMRVVAAEHDHGPHFRY